MNEAVQDGSRILDSLEYQGARLVLVQLDPGVEKCRSRCPDGQFWIILQGGWECTTKSPVSKIADAFSLSYYLPTEKNQRRASPTGAIAFGIQISNDSIGKPGPYESLPKLRDRTDVQFASLDAAKVFIAFASREEGVDFLLEESLFWLVERCAGVSSKCRETQSAGWLRRAHEMIRSESFDRLTINGLAADCGVHPTYLIAAFRGKFGESPGEMLRRIRIEKAATAVGSTEASIGEIAAGCGYFDQPHMDRAFRSLLGTTPKKFRKLCRRP